jgi:P4 family phage/plasmid primase-like protien
MSADDREAATQEQVVQWHRALLSGDRGHLAYLYDRGLPLSILEEHQVGWDGERITFPVRNTNGLVVNVRRHRPGAKHKMLPLKDFGSPTRLYPAVAVPASERGDWIFAVGGELDALSARSEGLMAFCGTNGEGSVPGDLSLLTGMRVAVAMDGDAPGRAAAVRWAAKLRTVAQEVHALDLPEGQDVNDLMCSGGARALLALLPSSGDEATGSPTQTTRRSSDELLLRAREKVAEEGGRNLAGFWLACQLRDERYSEDEGQAVMSKFAGEFKHVPGKTDYTEDDALESLRSAWTAPPRVAIGPVGAGSPRAFPLTEMGNAERFVAAHGADVRWVAALVGWYRWDGRRWAPDEHNSVMQLMKGVVRNIAKEADGADETKAKEIRQWARQSESNAHLRSALELVKSEPHISMSASAFDSDPLLLNCENGLLDLRTGQLRPHERNAYCQKMVPVPYDAAAKAPRFDAFLEQIQPESEMRAFLLRAAGYSLTGMTSEQKLLLLHGSGANGKSVLVELFHDVLGPYATYLPAEALAARGGDRIPNDIARLPGARFISVMEFEDRAPLNERLVKQLTGGDAVQARFMRGEFFDFRPQGTLWVSTNHRPIIKGTDDGIWRRFLLVPFLVRIEEADRDPHLGERLREELPGVLVRLVEGAVAWQLEGLNPPTSVLNATRAYRDESDLVGAFLDDSCDLDASASTTKRDLFSAYQEWARATGNHPWSMSALGRELRQREQLGLDETRHGKNRVDVWLGVRV